MNKFLYTFGYVFISGVMVTSCAMKDELTGKSEHYSYGDLVLNISNNAKVDVVSRTEAESNGSKPGVFPAEDVDINNYTLKVFDSNGEEQKSGLISELGKNGVVSLTLLEGDYTIKAYNYDGSEVNVSEKPFFMGASSMSVRPGTTTDAEVPCKLQNMEVVFSLDQSFKDSFKDDFEFTVDNGETAQLRINKDNINTKYYMKVPENKSILTASVKATTVATELTPEQNIQRTYKITKPADTEGDTNLDGGDAFIINITEDGSSVSHIDFGMSVDFIFAEQEETITIPVEEITFNPGEDPEEPVDPAPGEAITFEGLPAEYTNPALSGTQVVVTINAEKGIENLFVTINSNNEGFMSTLTGFGLGEKFDIANPGELEPVLTGSLEDQTGIGLLKPGQSVKGETQFVFDVTDFMGLLPLYGVSNNTFSIEVVDTEGNKKSGDLKVVISQ